ncbi:MAG: SH3 domain-containing protein, partial [Nitrospinaceae bacterium]
PHPEVDILSTAVLDPSLGIELGEREMLLTATIDPTPESVLKPVSESVLDKETSNVEEHVLLDTEDEIVFEPESEPPAPIEEVEIAQEPEHHEETPVNVELAPEIDASIKEVVQTTQIEKPSAERLQDEIDIVSKITSSTDKQEDLSRMKPVRRKKFSDEPEEIQVAKRVPEHKKTPLLEEPVTGRVCVRSKKANLRKGPGKNHQKLAQVKMYTPFERLKESGKWIKIRNSQEETYWIYKALVTEKYLCGTVAQDGVDFYTQPDFNSFPFYGASLDTGFSVRILSLENENDWVKVMDSAKNISWVQKSMLWIR